MKMNFVIVASILLGSGTAQRPSLRDEVRQRNAPVEKRFRVLPEPQSVEKLLEKSDLVVRGVVGEARGSYLTSDSSDVRTDYFLRASEVVYDANPTSNLLAAERPVQLTVVQQGGTVMIDGFPATVRHLALPPLNPGTEVLMFLVRTGDKYEITSDYFGVFAVNAGLVRPLGKSSVFDQRIRDGLTLSEFLGDIEAARVALGR
jgi:hypothetical protein